MACYYNENDPRAAAWLRELIKANLIAPGEVDERSIEDVQPEDLKGFTQCHFFAGIGVWSYALRLAGWPDDRPVWTGSCPCQPFSAAGKQKGLKDERHLWPAWVQLIDAIRPPVIFGEQVASAEVVGKSDAGIGGLFAGLDEGLQGEDERVWFDALSDDLEGASYTVGALDIPACSVGAPHRRQRLYFVADAIGRRCEQWNASLGRVSKPDSLGATGNGLHTEHSGYDRPEINPSGWLNAAAARSVAAAGATRGFWANCDWWYGRDGKYRPIESPIQPLVDGSAESMGPLCAESIIAIEKEINETAKRHQTEPRKAVCDLWQTLAAETLEHWRLRRPNGIQQAPVLLAFLR